MSKFFDAHTHVNFSAFRDDWKAVVRRALDKSVWFNTVGTQKDTSRRAVEIANEYPEGIYATVGLHPIHTSKSFYDASELGAPSTGSGQGSEIKGFMSRGEEFDYEYYKKLALDPKVVAIGECGLDYADFISKRSERLQNPCLPARSARALARRVGREHPADLSARRSERAEEEALSEGGLSEEEIKRRKAKQKKVFEMQIELAKETDKPLMIHCRDAFQETLDMLRAAKVKSGIAHSFVRTINEARGLLDLGFYFTFAGNITFKPRRDKPPVDEVIKFIPMDRIMSETDAPYMAPGPYRGKRNEPAYVVEVVNKLAEIKGVTAEKMREIICENARCVFRL